MLDGKNKAYFGRFSSELDAAIAYDHAAIQFRCIKVRNNFNTCIQFLISYYS